MLGGDLCDLLILVFKMASVSGLIVWKVDPDLAGVDIRVLCEHSEVHFFVWRGTR